MAVARDDLRGDRLRLEAKLRRNIGLDARIEMRKRADRARDCAGSDILFRAGEPLFRAGKLGISEGELQPEGRGLGVDAMATANRDGEFVLDRAALQRIEQRIQIRKQNI